MPVQLDGQIDTNYNLRLVELKCDDAELTNPNTLYNLNCKVSNLTDKAVTAASIAFTITTEKNGRSSPDTAIINLWHPEPSEEGAKNIIPPRGESSVSPLPVEYDGRITLISMRVDYIEFADGTNWGPNQSGSRLITGMRKGAAKYKEWLRSKYQESGKSPSTFATLLEQDEAALRNELHLQADSQQEGAALYRRYVNRVIKKNGVKSFIKRLEQTNNFPTKRSRS